VELLKIAEPTVEVHFLMMFFAVFAQLLSFLAWCSQWRGDGGVSSGSVLVGSGEGEASASEGAGVATAE
jgi:hypothetical protein